MSDTTSENNSNQQRPKGLEALKRHCIANKIDVALWAIRMLTIICAFFYVIPIFG